MKKTAFLFAIALVVFAYPAFSQSQLLDVQAFEKKLETTKDKTVLDVRTSDEFKSGHIAGAVTIDYYKPEFKQELAKLDKSKPIFVYCAGGVRSKGAAQSLTDLGFKQIFELSGGLNAWKGAQKPVVK